MFLKQKNILTQGSIFTYMKRILTAMLFTFFLVLCAQPLRAIGVAQEYLENNTLYLKPGAERLFTVTVQNPDEQNITVTLGLKSDIVTIINPQESYMIPAKCYDFHIDLRIKIPRSGPIRCRNLGSADY